MLHIMYVILQWSDNSRNISYVNNAILIICQAHCEIIFEPVAAAFHVQFTKSFTDLVKSVALLFV